MHMVMYVHGKIENILFSKNANLMRGDTPPSLKSVESVSTPGGGTATMMPHGEKQQFVVNSILKRSVTAGDGETSFSRSDCTMGIVDSGITSHRLRDFSDRSVNFVDSNRGHIAGKYLVKQNYGKRIKSLDSEELRGPFANRSLSNSSNGGSIERCKSRFKTQNRRSTSPRRQLLQYERRDQHLLKIQQQQELLANPFIRAAAPSVKSPSRLESQSAGIFAATRYRRHSEANQELVTGLVGKSIPSHAQCDLSLRNDRRPIDSQQHQYDAYTAVESPTVDVWHCTSPSPNDQESNKNYANGSLMVTSLGTAPALSLSTLSTVSTRFTTPSPFTVRVSSTATTTTPVPSPIPAPPFSIAYGIGAGAGTVLGGCTASDALLSPTAHSPSIGDAFSFSDRATPSNSISFQFSSSPSNYDGKYDLLKLHGYDNDSAIGTVTTGAQRRAFRASYFSMSSSAENLGAKGNSSIGSRLEPYPQVQLNGSLLSIGNVQLLESASRLMEQYAQRRNSVGSAHSDSKRNLLLLHNVGKTLQRTHNQLKKTRLLHGFYLFALPIYTLFGAFIFQALDGAHDDHFMRLYDMRCRKDRATRLEELRLRCRATQIINSVNVAVSNGIDYRNDTCFDEMSAFLAEVETCYRRWHAVNKTMNHPMSDFTNAVIYAFSVYTTIGYGTISANSVAARIATVIYGACGIPLFFAFIKEEGNQCRMCFIWLYNWVKRWRRRRRKFKFVHHERTEEDGDGDAPNIRQGEDGKKTSAWSWSFYLCVNETEKKKDILSIPKIPSAIENLTLISNVEKEARSVLMTGENSDQDYCYCNETTPQMKETNRNGNNNKNSQQNYNKNNSNTNESNENMKCIYEKLLSDLSYNAKDATTKLFDTSYAKYALQKSSSSGIGGASQRCALEQRRVFICGVIVFIVYLLAVSVLFSMMTDWDFFTAFYFLFNSVALIGFGDVFPTQSSVILVNMFFIVMGVVLFSMCYFILQEEIRVKAFEASRLARMSISKYSHSLMLHTKNPWSRRNSPSFDRSPYSDGDGERTTRKTSASCNISGASSAFDRLRKRRQSAPVITLSGTSRKSSRAEVLYA